MGSGSVRICEERCEITFPLNGTTTTLRVTYQSIIETETLLGMGIVPLANRIAHKNFGIIEAATIFMCGIKAANPKVNVTTEATACEIFKAGILSDVVSQAITGFCELALNGGQKAGEPKAAVKDNS